MSAATDAIGRCVFIGTLYELEVPSRDCHVGLRPPRNDKPLAFTVLSMACTDRQHCAGPGCPLPYNGVYNRREYPKICSCQWRSLTAATDAIGFYVFIGTLYELEVPSRDCHVASLLGMTNLIALRRRITAAIAATAYGGH